MGEFSDYYYTPEDAKAEREAQRVRDWQNAKRERDRAKRAAFEAQIRADYIRRDIEEVRAMYEMRPNVFSTNPPLWQLKKAFQDMSEHFANIGKGIPAANLPLPDIDGTESNVNEELRINMSVTDILREEMQREALQKELDRKRAMIAAYGVDTFNDNTVIRFAKYFPQQGDKAKRYEYAALKCEDGKWYTTGPKVQSGFSWTDLVLWLIEHPTLPTEAHSVWVMSEDIDVATLVERAPKPVAAIEGKVVVDQTVTTKKATPRKRTATK